MAAIVKIFSETYCNVKYFSAIYTHRSKTNQPTRRTKLNTTDRTDRTTEFYRDAFTSATTWGPGIFEAECAAHGIAREDGEFFGHTAERLWDALSEAERAEFEADYDDWLDA